MNNFLLLAILISQIVWSATYYQQKSFHNRMIQMHERRHELTGMRIELLRKHIKDLEEREQ